MFSLPRKNIKKVRQTKRIIFHLYLHIAQRTNIKNDCPATNQIKNVLDLKIKANNC